MTGSKGKPLVWNNLPATTFKLTLGGLNKQDICSIHPVLCVSLEFYYEPLFDF